MTSAYHCIYLSHQPTAQSSVVFTSWSTSNLDTLGNTLQVHEQLLVNITIVIPEVSACECNVSKGV